MFGFDIKKSHVKTQFSCINYMQFHNRLTLYVKTKLDIRKIYIHALQRKSPYKHSDQRNSRCMSSCM